MRRSLKWSVLFVLVFISFAWALDAPLTQLSTDGNFEGALLRCSVRDNVLTIQVSFKNLGQQRLSYAFPFADVYYTDIKNKKKYYPLKDSGGRVLAGPAHDWIGGGNFEQWIDPGTKRIFWIKFPAPPETTDSIDIYIPGMLPFEGAKISR
ncbi:MAG: hypothetical protein DRG59_00660 [Deltaproteobacteria bacterium]|nr:MAG: hypothetical protein DRG83_02210 [Deltaproteobacteria bacterium]RLB10030.1 MAG: hypothetical protein DRG59_00660 [Deltaproteobacteria bacterium]